MQCLHDIALVSEWKLHEIEGGQTSQLWRRRAQYRDKARGVDDAATDMEALGLVRGVLAHREDRVLAPPPHALEVNLHREVPNLLLGVERVVVRRVHDACQSHMDEWMCTRDERCRDIPALLNWNSNAGT